MILWLKYMNLVKNSFFFELAFLAIMVHGMEANIFKFVIKMNTFIYIYSTMYTNLNKVSKTLMI